MAQATEDINVVDPTNQAGTNYTSYQAWETAEDGDITATGSDVSAVAECRGGADNSIVGAGGGAGWTTDVDHPVIIRNHSDESPDGTFNSSRFYFDLDTDGDYMYVTESNWWIYNLQFDNSAGTQSANDQFCLKIIQSANEHAEYRIYNNIFKSDETAGSSRAVSLHNVRANGSVFAFFNNMVMCNEDCLYLYQVYNYTGDLYIANNTLIGVDIGMYANGSYFGNLTQYIRNNIVHVSNADRPYYPEETTPSYWTDNDSNNDYNFDNDTHATEHPPRGTNGGGSSNFVFEAESGATYTWDGRITDSDTVAKGNGEDLSDFASFPTWLKTALGTDIAGNVRGDTWDAGAYQITVADLTISVNDSGVITENLDKSLSLGDIFVAECTDIEDLLT